MRKFDASGRLSFDKCDCHGVPSFQNIVNVNLFCHRLKGYHQIPSSRDFHRCLNASVDDAALCGAQRADTYGTGNQPGEIDIAVAAHRRPHATGATAVSVAGRWRNRQRCRR